MVLPLPGRPTNDTMSPGSKPGHRVQGRPAEADSGLLVLGPLVDVVADHQVVGLAEVDDQVSVPLRREPHDRLGHDLQRPLGVLMVDPEHLGGLFHALLELELDVAGLQDVQVVLRALLGLGQLHLGVRQDRLWVG
jgi:hypothetical protein